MSRTTRWLLFVTIMLLAAALRFWHLDQTPPGFYRDESVEGVAAWRILTEPAYRPLYLTEGTGIEALNAYANALMFWLVRAWGGEAGPFAMRLTAACFGLLGIGAVYGLGLELQRLDQASSTQPPSRVTQDPPNGVSNVTHSLVFPLFAMAALTGMRWHIHFSRIGIEPIIVPIIWAGAFWALFHGWRTNHWWSFIGCGIFVAAAMYTYPGAWVIPLLVAVVGGYLLYLDLRAWRWAKGSDHRQPPMPLIKQRWLGLLLAALVAVILFAPLAWFAWQNRELVSLRLVQLNIASGEKVVVDQAWWHNTWATLKMFGPLGAPGDPQIRRNIPGAPALNFWLAIPFYLGLAVTVWRIRRPGYFALLIGLLGLLAPGMLSQEAPHFHRVLGASAPTALLCGVGLDQIWQWRPGRRYQLQWATVLLLTAATLISARDYFVRWATQPALYTEFNVGLWTISQQLAKLPPDQTIYMTPREADHPTLEFALRTHQHPRPIEFDGRYIFPFTDHVNTQPEWYMIFSRRDTQTATAISQIFPTASAQSFRDDSGELFAQLYQRPAATRPQRAPEYLLRQPVGDGIVLQGYDLPSLSIHPSVTLTLQLHWLVTTPPTAKWKVNLRLVHRDTAGGIQIVAEYKNRPGRSSLLTDQWQTGWRLVDNYALTLPPALDPGQYDLVVSLFQLSGETLPDIHLHTFTLLAKL